MLAPGRSRLRGQLGADYEVEAIRVGGFFSEIELKEFPGIRFNSVFFKRAASKEGSEC